MRSDELLGGVAIAVIVADRVATKKAAKAEGITYKEMKLRQKAANARYKAGNTNNERRRRKWEARAAGYDEQLAHFAKTREQKQKDSREEVAGCVNNQTSKHYCVHCGTKMVEGANFCGGCGTKVEYHGNRTSAISDEIPAVHASAE